MEAYRAKGIYQSYSHQASTAELVRGRTQTIANPGELASHLIEKLRKKFQRPQDSKGAERLMLPLIFVIAPCLKGFTSRPP
jgi:hypothetical protein